MSDETKRILEQPGSGIGDVEPKAVELKAPIAVGVEAGIAGPRGSEARTHRKDRRLGVPRAHQVSPQLDSLSARFAKRLHGRSAFGFAPDTRWTRVGFPDAHSALTEAIGAGESAQPRLLDRPWGHS